MIAQGITEVMRNGDMEEGPQDALLGKVLAKSAVHLNASSGCDKLGLLC